MAISSPPDNSVVITNREIYDMVKSLQTKVTTLMTFNGLFVAVITYLVIEGLKA